ncbi:bifunctional phosphoribosyl-AMP cyclohydrolase/phosphoribosyl-ATP diphosphatase HisIE [Virgibacillus sp. NKC19-3]|uniref:bifunctional phosphoribosyl-AMP cyclohydrolase/phosphoribosyl-ATP diphosphatase HisIE n=1 Tax=Virgibacillus saliphilus TaxID=2831674 RepID=UPI001C9A7C75|nr:bifunctional phosphoribosyl-AMP cyclohydrolase/phosphoribosyl-ATP diphosphatase HisIE [Virgibacillus sp. NKC19-3]MBY7142237.1 bifunctional phosphoribosyl-AMP cyclohydrolase/phosphoribosyl-ATP diphosphatase HisIE [Virgibacillus sp. NKC19-3]
MEVNMKQLTFDEHGLIPAIVQDAETGNVLTLAYMNEASILKTIQTNETWFFSRKRQELWNKGETSGNKQQVKKITFDCDTDALLIQVKPLGPACHTGADTCFHQVLHEQEAVTTDVIHTIARKIKARRQQPVEGSYTTYLFHEGIDKVLKKIGEEASEVIIGAKNTSKKEVTWEISDLIYHNLVLMELLDVRIEDLKKELHSRHIQKEGHANE